MFFGNQAIAVNRSKGALAGALLLVLALPAWGQAAQKPAAPAKAAPAQQAPAKPGTQPAAPAPNVKGKDVPGAVQVKPNPIFPTAPVEKRQFAVEYLINYTRQAYRPAVAIESVNRGNASYNTPEEAFITQMSAMRAGDYEWWITGWNEASQKQMRARDTANQRGAAFWRQAWQKVFEGKRVNLLERLESGPYVLLVYTLTVPAQDNRVDFRGLFVARKDGERWVSTQELGNDLLFHHYLEGNNKLTRDTELQPYPAQTPNEIAADGVWRGREAQVDFLKSYAQGREQVTHVVR